MTSDKTRENAIRDLDADKGNDVFGGAIRFRKNMNAQVKIGFAGIGPVASNPQPLPPPRWGRLYGRIRRSGY